MRIDTLDRLSKSYTHVYISPHPDDVVLSCGGRIINQSLKGETVLVITVFCADDDTALNNDAGYRHIADFKLRRAEDERAMDRINADFAHFSYPDAIFRLKNKLTRFRPFLPKRSELHTSISNNLHQWLKRTNARNIYFPLGVGQHIDHLILYQIGRDMAQKAGAGIQFYEDIPYSYIRAAYYHRLAQIGARHNVPKISDHTRLFRDIVANHRLFVGFSGLKLTRPFARGLSFPFFVLASFLLFYASDIYPSIGKKAATQLKSIDIARVLEKKWAAVCAYQSQIEANAWKGKEFWDHMLKYSMIANKETTRIVERYWTFGDDGCRRHGRESAA